MMRRTAIALSAVVALSVAACNSDEAQITTTTIDAALLTTTTASTTPPETEATDTTETTQPSEPVESWEVISRQSTDEGETLYILVEPGEYTDVSIENFLGDLLEEDTAVSGVEVFDDRAALDAALKPEGERTEQERQLIQQHHLVSLASGRQVNFRGPLSDYEDFILGS